MRGIIILNGEPYAGGIDDQSAYVLCVDGGYNWAGGRVRIDENLGDFDSVSEPPFPPPLTVYPSEKNFTDGELALEKMLSMFEKGKIEEIVIYGGGGGREDHFIGNLHLLYRACKAGVPCEMVTNRAVLRVYKGEFSLKNILGKTVSLLPFGGDAHIMYNKGLYYSTDDLWLAYGSCRGVSNVGVSQTACIHCDQGYVLAAINRDESEKIGGGRKQSGETCGSKRG